MNLSLLSLGLVLFSLTFAEGVVNYGGKPAKIGMFPYAAILSFNGEADCGASIIHKRWAVTAAHCVEDPIQKNTILEVGSVGYVGSGTTYKIKEFYSHPNYTYKPLGFGHVPDIILNDVGLIHLASDIEFNDNVNPTALETDEENSYENKNAIQMGWGMESVRRYFEKHNLRYISAKVLPLNQCRKTYAYADKHICTSNAGGQGTCHGDSGSPLVFENVQIGIVSAGDPDCLRMWPDLYTEVASFVPWIKEILKQHGDVLPDLQTDAQPNVTDIAGKSDEDKQKSLHDYLFDFLNAVLSLFE